MREEPGLSSPQLFPGRVTWVLGYLCVSGPGQGPGVLDPACASSVGRGAAPKFHGKVREQFVAQSGVAALGVPHPPWHALCVCAHVCLQWILEGTPLGMPRFPKTCSLQLSPVLRSGMLQETPVCGDETPLVQRSGTLIPLFGNLPVTN